MPSYDWNCQLGIRTTGSLLSICFIGLKKISIFVPQQLHLYCKNKIIAALSSDYNGRGDVRN